MAGQLRIDVGESGDGNITVLCEREGIEVKLPSRHDLRLAVVAIVVDDQILDYLLPDMHEPARK
jgi:hypothetical protein